MSVFCIFYVYNTGLIYRSVTWTSYKWCK